MTTPRYLRFARALALCSSLAVVPGCPDSSSGTDAGDEDAPSGTDAPIAAEDAPIATEDAPGTDAPIAAEDAPTDASEAIADAGDCNTCDCGFVPVDAGLPTCDSIGLFTCCAAVGPLAPPDLPA